MVKGFQCHTKHPQQHFMTWNVHLHTHKTNKDKPFQIFYLCCPWLASFTWQQQQQSNNLIIRNIAHEKPITTTSIPTVTWLNEDHSHTIHYNNDYYITRPNMKLHEKHTHTEYIILSPLIIMCISLCRLVIHLALKTVFNNFPFWLLNKGCLYCQGQHIVSYSNSSGKMNHIVEYFLLQPLELTDSVVIIYTRSMLEPVI